MMMFAIVHPRAGATATAAALNFSDVNLLVTTDMHAWVEGRAHQPHLNATIADMVSMFVRLKAAAAAQGRDVFLFDNGDINDGTGLSATASNHVDYLAPLLRQVPYDALNCGNHELYQRGNGKNNDCPISGLQLNGFIDHWDGRYLTSNIVSPDSLLPVGSRYARLTGHFGTELLVFGFFYNMEDHCPAVAVQKVETTVQAPWFVEALKQASAVDAVVVLAHMDADDPLVRVIHSAIRAVVGPRKPVQFLTGHSHQRKFSRLDGFATSFEAGCKLDTVGFISFPSVTPLDMPEIAFNYANIDGNTASFAQSLNLSTSQVPATSAGEALSAEMAKTRAALRLDSVIGHASQEYRCNADLSSADSLFALYINEAVPMVLFENRSAGIPQWAVFGTGALTYNVFRGNVTVDDCYKASPYANFWYTVPGISSQLLQPLLAQLNSASSTAMDKPDVTKQRAREPIGTVANMMLPSYVATAPSKSSAKHDVIYCDFDATPVEAALVELGVDPAWIAEERSMYRPGFNDTSVLLEYFRQR